MRMPSETQRREVLPEQARVPSPWDAVRAHLEHLRGDVYERIRAYPTPITGCDDQFNYLLERRDAVVEELARLDAAVAAHADQGDSDAVAAFLRDSRCIDGDVARRMLAVQGA